MAEEITEEWQRLEKGNDHEAWAWAMNLVKKGTVIPLATIGNEGPRVRPMTTVLYEDRVYVITWSMDAKVHQLAGDPHFEFYVLAKEEENTGYARLRGTAHPVEDPDLRKAVGEASGFLYKYFDGPEDPGYTLLNLEITAAEVMRSTAT